MEIVFNEKKKHLGELQWGGKFWGYSGAIRLGNELFGTKIYSQDKREKMEAIMTLASLYYSAASTAGTKSKEQSGYKKVFWLTRSFTSLLQAWRYVERAIDLDKLNGYHLGTTDLDVIQTIARQCAKRCPSFLPSMCDTFKDCAYKAIRKALKNKQCNGLSRALLLCGDTDLLLLDKQYALAEDSMSNAYKIALRVHYSNPNTQDKRQLSRIFRHTLEHATTLLHVRIKSSGSSIEIIRQNSEKFATLYAQESQDQQVKLKALLTEKC
jgi:hypothetical protein